MNIILVIVVVVVAVAVVVAAKDSRLLLSTLQKATILGTIYTLRSLH